MVRELSSPESVFSGVQQGCSRTNINDLSDALSSNILLAVRRWYIGIHLEYIWTISQVGDGRRETILACLPGRWEIDRWEMTGMTDGRWEIDQKSPYLPIGDGSCGPNFPPPVERYRAAQLLKNHISMHIWFVPVSDLSKPIEVQKYSPQTIKIHIYFVFKPIVLFLYNDESFRSDPSLIIIIYEVSKGL